MYSNYKTITQIEVTVTAFTAIHLMIVVIPTGLCHQCLSYGDQYFVQDCRLFIILCTKFFYEGPLVFKRCKVLLLFTFIQNGTVIQLIRIKVNFAPQLQPQNQISSNVT